MVRFRPRPAIVPMILAVWGWAGPAAWAGQIHSAARAQFKEATMIIEFNSSAEDVGIQFFLDAEEWQSVKIFDPQGNAIFNATASGRLLEQGGGTELFLESVEPALADLPLEEFFERSRRESTASWAAPPAASKSPARWSSATTSQPGRKS